MKLHRMLPVVVVLSLLALAASMSAQPGAVAGQAGEVGLGLVLRQLGNVGVFLQAVGHPDDENSAVLAMLTHGQGYRTAVLTATRGTGGQNEIGPELFEALSVLRTEELAAVHRYDGAEQYFARAIDFGYSFSVDETYQKWGKQEILDDYVRMIRTIRPDVIVTMRAEGEQGGAHHQAQARIMGEAFRLAADPTSFPEQLKQGLRPWQARKLYYQEGYGGGPAGAPAAGGAPLVRIATDVYDPLLGRTWSEIGSLARSQHKCQGMAQLLFLPGGGGGGSYRLGATTLPGGTGRTDQALFDGIDSSLASLAGFAGASAPEALKAGLAAVAAQADSAEKVFRSQGPEAAREPIVAGLGAVRALRSRLGSLGLDEAARYDIDYAAEAQGRPVPARRGAGAGRPDRRAGRRRGRVCGTAGARADDRGQPGRGRSGSEEDLAVRIRRRPVVRHRRGQRRRRHAALRPRREDPRHRARDHTLLAPAAGRRPVRV